MLETYDRFAVSHMYIDRMYRYWQQRYELWDGTVLREDLSALFARRAEIEVTSNRPADILDLEIQTRVKAEFTAPGATTLKKLEEAGVDRAAVARTGAGGYAPFPIKRLRSWVRQTVPLHEDTPNLWRMPWWRESGLINVNALLTEYHRRSIDNMHRIDSDPELILGNKPPTTSTGYSGTISTRGDAVHGIRRHMDSVIDCIDQYYTDLNQAVQQWPDQDSIIRVQRGWHGIRSGVRSDADVTNWPTLGEQTITSTTREISNDPSSIAHNQTLNPRSWSITLWHRYMSGYHLSPYVHGNELDIQMTPPVSADFFDANDGNEYVLSCDVGYQSPPSKFVNGKFHQAEERVKFGADQICLHGIATQSSDTQQLFMMLTSGSPFTMSIYLVLFGEALAYVCRRLSLHVKIYQVGDDIHIKGPGHELIALLDSDIGAWLRTKGMKGNTNFITGKYVTWITPDRALFYIMPRVFKSMTSPKAAERMVERMGKTPFVDILQTDPLVEQEAVNIAKLYPDYLFFDGDPSEWRAIMETMAVDARAAMARQGISDWAQMFAGDDSNAWD